jgi:hypothetical protein
VSNPPLAHALPRLPRPVERRTLPSPVEVAVKICRRVMPWRTRTRIVVRGVTTRGCRGRPDPDHSADRPVARQADPRGRRARRDRREGSAARVPRQAAVVVAAAVAVAPAAAAVVAALVLDRVATAARARLKAWATKRSSLVAPAGRRDVQVRPAARATLVADPAARARVADRRTQADRAVVVWAGLVDPAAA